MRCFLATVLALKCSRSGFTKPGRTFVALVAHRPPVQVLECYRRLGWWPAEQVEALVGRQQEVEAEVETARVRRARRAAVALAVRRGG